MIKRCILCQKIFEPLQLLTNGKYYHTECYDNLNGKIDLFSNQIFQTQNRIYEVEKTYNNIFSKIKRFVFMNNSEDITKESEIKQLNKKIKDYITLIDQEKLSLISIHDYWLNRPPDWEERRQRSIQKYPFCEKCFSTYEDNITLHVHHKIRVSEGGSHKPDNLVVLCERCHQSKHKSIFQYKNVEKQESPFAKKLMRIKTALEKNSIISFDYRKYGGERSHRTIKPYNFKLVKNSLCIYGFCYLRKDFRTFAIRRIYNLMEK